MTSCRAVLFVVSVIPVVLIVSVIPVVPIILIVSNHNASFCHVHSSHGYWYSAILIISVIPVIPIIPMVPTSQPNQNASFCHSCGSTLKFNSRGVRMWEQCCGSHFVAPTPRNTTKSPTLSCDLTSQPIRMLLFIKSHSCYEILWDFIRKNIHLKSKAVEELC